MTRPSPRQLDERLSRVLEQHEDVLLQQKPIAIGFSVTYQSGLTSVDVFSQIGKVEWGFDRILGISALPVQKITFQGHGRLSKKFIGPVPVYGHDFLADH